MAAAVAEAQRADGRQPFGELLVPDEVEEQFELCGESTPYLRSRARREERMAMPGKGAELLSDGRRLVVGQFLMSAISQIWTGAAGRACLQKVWFDSMHLCDLAQSLGLDVAGQAMSHAMAVVRILWKAEDATRSLPSASLATLTEVFSRGGFGLPPALPDDIDGAERRILHCLGWQGSSPSFHSWLAAFFSRLAVLLRQHLAGRAGRGERAAEGAVLQREADVEAVLQQLWGPIYACGTAVVMHNASLGQLPPRSLAIGLLVLGCVRAGVLPVDCTRPAWFGPAEWEQVYARAMGPAPAFQGHPDGKELAAIVQVATDSGLGAVQEACLQVALAVPGVPMASLREPSAF